MKLLPLGLLSTAYVYAVDEEAAWQTFETVEDEIEQIEEDLKDYQQVGVCGNTHISPNEWLFANAKTRREAESYDETVDFGGFERIVGGKEAKAHSWPWIAFLDFGRKWCGGTIIHPKYVLTAVHCVHKESLPRIILGAHDKTHTEGSIVVKAKKITLYPEFYKPVDYNNDIAIIELEEPVQFTDQIKPLCLPPTDSYLDPEKPGTVCVAAGWGADSFKKSSYPNALHEVDINLIDRKVCNQIPGYENMVTNKMFCAGHLEGGKDTCQGDSGGPLMCRLIGPGNPWILYGVTSWGIGCAQAYTPGVYVKVSKFINWIEKETGVVPSIKSSDYFNLDAVEPASNFPNENESNVVDAAYFTQNIQTQADSWEFQHHIQEQKICGGERWGPSGTIESDGYPYRYPARQYCKWKITARDPKNLIVLKFKDIQLDSDTECILNDHIMVFDHYNQIVGTPQCKLAKKTVWTVTGRRYVTIYFNTNEHNEGNGFKVDYYEEPDPEKQHVEAAKAARTCSDKWRLEALPRVQQLTSPGWPMKYPLNTACFWRIRSPTELHIIHFQFKNVLMEGPSEETGECEYDFVKVYKGINDYFEENLMATKCGTLNSSKLTQVYKGDQGNSLYVKFQSDNRNNGRGFSAFYLASKSPDLRPKPTLSPSMQRWVLENQGVTASTGDNGLSAFEHVSSGGSKKSKKNKKKKNKLQRTRLWDITERDVLKAEKITAQNNEKVRYW